MSHWLSWENHLNNCQTYCLKGSFARTSQSNEVHLNEEVIDPCTHPRDNDDEWPQWLGGGKWHGGLPVTKTLPTIWDESVIWTGEVRWIVGWKGKKERRKCRERDCKVSPTAVPWKVPERAYTSPASLFFTRQAVLGTFSRSVASASCQSKQRACFVKPKVKLRSNEGTALTGGTSSIILPQLPAEKTQHTLYVCETVCCASAQAADAKLPRLAALFSNLPLYGSQHATCLMKDITALMFNYGRIIWYTARWQIQLPLLKIWSLRWSESPPVKQVFWERVCGILRSISGDRQLTVKKEEAQLWVKRCKNIQSKTSWEQNQVEQIRGTKAEKRNLPITQKRKNDCKILQKPQINPLWKKRLWLYKRQILEMFRIWFLVCNLFFLFYRDQVSAWLLLAEQANTHIINRWATLTISKQYIQHHSLLQRNT